MSWIRAGVGLGTLAAVVLSTPMARADDEELPSLPATESPAAPAIASKDVVRLKNGGIVRGTILESMPNHHVTIQLATGQTRTFRWTEATYVGSEADATANELDANVSPRIKPDGPVRVEKRLRSTGALVGGIVASVASQISVAIAGFAWIDHLKCVNDRRREAYPVTISNPYPIFPSTDSCDNTGAIVGGLIGAVVLLGAGVPLIVYGAKRVPVEKEKAVGFVPWTQGTTAAGGSLQLRF